ncbi:hypothetical protein [Nocardioides sp. 503]|nr:hypothetical protein [Nocardioides sp. 503]
MTDNRFASLPEPVRLEDTLTSHDVADHPDESGELNEVAWVLRHGAG